MVELGGLTANGVTRPGQIQVVKGQGMPVYESVRTLFTLRGRPVVNHLVIIVYTIVLKHVSCHTST